MRHLHSISRFAKTRCNIICCQSLFLLISMPLSAQDFVSDSVSGFYVGAGAGYSNVYSWEDDNDDDDFDGSIDNGDGDFGFSLITGYRFNPYIAIEAAYVDSGTSDWDNQLAFIDDSGDLYEVDANVDLTSYQVSVVGILPFLNIWEVYVRGGAAFWDGESSQQLTRLADGELSTRRLDDDDLDFIFGAGGGVTVGRSWNLRAEYSVFRVDDDLLALGRNEDAYSDMFSIQAMYHFGARPNSQPLERPDQD
jgi:OOP family OmpA-OmpF porin